MFLTKRIGWLLLSVITLSPIAKATCYIEVDPRVACQPRQNSQIFWIPNLGARGQLFQSESVQQTLKGCSLMGELMKAECQPAKPVASIYMDMNGLKIETLQLEVKSAMNSDKTLPKAFSDYFAQTQSLLPNNGVINGKAESRPSDANNKPNPAPGFRYKLPTIPQRKTAK